MIEDFDRCYRAVRSRDPRFDGWFFTAVTSTGIYCRPSCPATVPRRDHVRFFASSAAAAHSGFRACKRCRPDAAPGSPEWNTRGDVVARAMRLIGDGLVDREGVDGLAGRLGYSVRQLERLLRAELGAGPLALARAQRAQAARTLIETTALPMTDVAFAAGFSSIRQFNDTMRAVFGSAPTQLRRRRAQPGETKLAAGTAPGTFLNLRLAFRRPLRPDNLFGHLAATAVPGVEEVCEGVYRRTLGLPGGGAIVELEPAPDHVACRIRLGDLRDLKAAIGRCRWLLDLDADPRAIDEHLALDPALRALVQRAPGRRVPRSVDGAEMALRTVLGQQISTAAARGLAAKLVAAHGEPIEDPHGGLTHLFAPPSALAEVDLPMPGSRRRTLAGLIAALSSGELSLDPGADRERALATLGRLPGIGPWTTQIIAMRALGDPDAFPASDLGVRRGAQALGLPGAAAALEQRSAPWSPWRAYAVQHLWGLLPHAVNQWPPPTEPDRARRAARAR